MSTNDILIEQVNDQGEVIESNQYHRKKRRIEHFHYPYQQEPQQHEDIKQSESNDIPNTSLFQPVLIHEKHGLYDPYEGMDKYRRIGYEYTKKKKPKLKELLRESDDEEEEHKQQECYLNTNESIDYEENIKQKEQAEIDAFHALYNYDTIRIEREREIYWKKKDIDEKWCFVCSYKRKTKAADRFHDLVQLESYWQHNLKASSIKDIVNIILDKFISDLRLELPKRPIDPYTKKPRPPHWWSTISIAEHFMEHDCNEYTYTMLRLRKSKRMIDICESQLRKVDEATQQEYLDRGLFLQRRQLEEEIRGYIGFLNKYEAAYVNNTTMQNAMNTAAAK